MNRQDKQRFVEIMTQAAITFDKSPTPQLFEVYWNTLADVSIEEFARGMSRLMRTARFFPKPAEILDAIDVANPTGHPGVEEAWNMCLRLRDSSETVIVTRQMMEAWAACSSCIEIGDEVGARMAFKEKYQSLLSGVRVAPAWEIQPGDDKNIRAMRVQEAVKLGRLSERALTIHGLPAPTKGISGLLEGAKERVRIATIEGKVVDHAAGALLHLEAIKELLNSKYIDDDKSAQRERDRQLFEEHRNAELERLAKKADENKPKRGEA